MKEKVLAGLALAVFAAAGNASASIIDGCPTNVPITASLEFYCNGALFDFGHNLEGDPIDPLPDGGSLILRSVGGGGLPGSGGYLQWNLDFGFPTPSARTTVLDYSASISGTSSGGVGGDAVGVGMSPYMIGYKPPFGPNETGSNFYISETVSSTAGLPVYLGIGPGGNDWNWLSADQIAQALYIETSITDRAGDLTGFNESFLNPEPAEWGLVASGLLAIWAFRRRFSA